MTGALPAAARYDAAARAYDLRWRGYVRKTTGLLLRYADVRAGARVLDVGCGTGTLLATLAGRVPAVTLAGADPSAGMLALARGKLASFPRKTLVQAPADALPFADGAFERVVSSSVLHYAPDPVAMLREMCRVCAPQGRVALLDWCADYGSVRALDAWLRYADPAHDRVFTTRDLEGLLAAARLVPERLFRVRTGPVWGFMVAVARPA